MPLLIPQAQNMSKALETINRLKGSIARHKDKADAIAGRGVTGAVTIGAGYGLGMAVNKFGDGGKLLIPGTEIDAGLAVGAALLACGVVGIGGDKYADVMTAAGAGIVGAQLAIATYQDGKVF
jgi:hypothetical protein